MFLTQFLLFKDFARVVRAAESEYDDSTLLRHRRELTEQLDEEDKPRARSKVSSALTISWKETNSAGFLI